MKKLNIRGCFRTIGIQAIDGTNIVNELEKSTTFNGTDIEIIVETGDFAPFGIPNVTQLDKIITVSTPQADKTLSCAHTINTYGVDDTYSLTLTESTARLAIEKIDSRTPALLHSVKFTLSGLDDSADNMFEFMYVGLGFHVVGDEYRLFGEHTT